MDEMVDSVQENRRPQREGQTNTATLDRSNRTPITAGKIGDIKGFNHMRDAATMGPDSTGGRKIVGITGRGSTR